jgi:hypothetical protein
VEDFKILERDEYTHLPQAISIKSNVRLDHNTGAENCISNSGINRKKLRWHPSSEEKFESDMLLNEIDVFNEKIDNNDVTGAAHVIAEMFSSACVRKKASRKKPVTKNAVWWDEELEVLKKQKYKCLRLYRLENCDRTFIEYCRMRKRFKSLIKKKKV